MICGHFFSMKVSSHAKQRAAMYAVFRRSKVLAVDSKQEFILNQQLELVKQVFCLFHEADL